MKCEKQSFWRAYADEDSTIEEPRRQEAGRHLKDCERCDLLDTKTTVQAEQQKGSF